MLTRNKKISLLTAALVLAVASSVPEFAHRFRADELQPAPSGSAAENSWDAVTLGRVEPRSGEIKIAAPVPGLIAQVPVKPTKTSSQVNCWFASMTRKRRRDWPKPTLRSPCTSAFATISPRRERRRIGARPRMQSPMPSEPSPTRKPRWTMSLINGGPTAHRRLISTRRVLACRARRIVCADSRMRWPSSRRRLTRHCRPDLEGELNVAQAEWTLARATLEKTRIRAPVDGVVLQIEAKKGEMAVPSLEPAMLVIGDMSALRVRAEVDEQHLGKIRVGERVLVRAAAFRDREFDGKVSSIARIVGPSRINSGDARRSDDVDVLDVRRRFVKSRSARRRRASRRLF